MIKSLPWYRVVQVGNGVWAIDEHGEVTAYLVVGSERAVLLDTGLGLGDIKAEIQQITEKPLTVVNTHGHVDHVGGNCLFSEIYIHKADAFFLDMERPANIEKRRGTLERLRSTIPDLKSFDLQDWVTFRSNKVNFVAEGAFFELGDRTLQVIETPGHSPGCISLFDAKNGYLFPGDMVSSEHIFMHLPDSTPLGVFLKSMNKLMPLTGNIDLIFPCHGREKGMPHIWNSQTPIDTRYIEELHECARRIIEDNSIGQTYDTIAGPGLYYEYGRASIVYKPEIES
ncbi:MBL fold metallo-hydrolase [Alicyclobacillus mengziensis]|uniref:MBL fold metallo-hydrolase n=1 Tax=Alicyclobacillus mengziensis TaxID=2931921 RepID=A0A9X7W4B0_9BACL|nr:MBL fold metallo-hydrolase [Alicyclobacillus mengziensis]QSO49328.1 MBL fold metallo-hydrolase [Alicyclobacillus mengziensis]